jgi:DNA-binding LacI/PurR family transcriptional regulator
LGHLAAQLLWERIQQPAAEFREILLPGELVIRESCLPAPATAAPGE